MRFDVNFRANIDLTIPERFEEQAFEVVKKAAELLLTEANRTVPKDTGLLLQSGKTSADEIAKVAAVSYDTPYAVRLHEHPEYNYKNGRRGKWLELTMIEKKDIIERYMAKEIKDILNRDLNGSSGG